VSIDPRAELERVARDGLAHARNGTISRAAARMELPSSRYTDPARFAQERDRIFRRVPLMLAAGCELPRPGDYKTIEVAGVPVLLVRGKDGVVNALVNACTHRGTFVAKGCGHAARFTCPYHGWSFALDGSLLAVASAADFGPVDKQAMGLVRLPCAERAGLVWAILDPQSRVDIDAFLGGFGAMLDCFGLANCHFMEQRCLEGTNWKLAHDAHADWYHLPVLHRDSFGPQTGNRTIYTSYGPHLRMFRPEAEMPPPPPEHDLYRLQDEQPSDWPVEAMMTGGWLAFPNLTMYALYREGRRYININQIMPGAHVGQSFTIQTTLSEAAPDDTVIRHARHIADMVEAVVRDEDLPNSELQQRALSSGLLKSIWFGENEEGNQHFHRWFDAVLDTDDAGLASLLSWGGDGSPRSG
jgi:phenylpropionate dioxygenase-like ring-hydroxylating dioxygenase large terminal subunit